MWVIKLLDFILYAMFLIFLSISHSTKVIV